MAKLFLMLLLGGALVEGLAAPNSEPPLLIDASPSQPLDATD